MNPLIQPIKVASPTADILHYQRDSNCTHIYRRGKGRNLLAALNLCKIQDILNQKQFVRLNRLNLVNIRFVNSYETRNKYVKLTLSNGHTLTTSRGRTESVLESLSTTNL